MSPTGKQNHESRLLQLRKDYREHIGAIHTQVLKRPLVIEKERINFFKSREPILQQIFDRLWLNHQDRSA